MAKGTLLNIVAGMDSSFRGEILINSKPLSESPYTDRIVVFQEGAIISMVNGISKY